MNSRPILRTCSKPYCPLLARQGSIYCETHQTELKPKRPPTPRKDLDLQKHYFTPRWRKFSKETIEALGKVCVICGAIEDLCLDHYLMSAKEMVDRTGGFIYDPAYYRVLCRKCNTKRKYAIPLIHSELPIIPTNNNQNQEEI